jgi:hypothetical protein
MKIDELFWFPEEQLDEIVRALYEIHGSPLDLAEAMAAYAAGHGYADCNGDFQKRLAEGQQITLRLLNAGTVVAFDLDPPNFVLRDPRKGTATQAIVFLRGLSMRGTRPVNKNALPGFLVKLSIGPGWVQKHFKRDGKRDWLSDLGIW